MKKVSYLAAAMAWLTLGTPAALAINHTQANRIHLFNAGQCTKPTGPLWIAIGTGQPAPGFININAPGFDQIGALLSGATPGQSEAALQAQAPACGVIASFYENATSVGAWLVPTDKLLQLISILRLNG